MGTYRKYNVSGISDYSAQPQFKSATDAKIMVIPNNLGEGLGADGRYLRDLVVALHQDNTALLAVVSGLKAANGGVTSGVALPTLHTVVQAL